MHMAKATGQESSSKKRVAHHRKIYNIRGRLFRSGWTKKGPVSRIQAV